ncbi:DUF4044 domain-containing protein [Xylocopilactobacillus apicola]|nr:DUF4044 domain-containing protein [Xylocopilactobacillus apicola]
MKKKTSKFQRITTIAVWLMIIATISGIVLSVVATITQW